MAIHLSENSVGLHGKIYLVVTTQHAVQQEEVEDVESLLSALHSAADNTS